MKTDGSDAKDKTKETSPEEQARKTLQHQIEKMAGQFENALPNKIGVERMMRIVMTAILNNPKLAQCEPNSFFGSLLQALQLGLEVNTPPSDRRG
ncbi:recombinase RecT [Treponema sp. R6D11]